MSNITLSFNTNNDAFQPDPTEEIFRILAETASRVYNEGLTNVTTIRDINGNKIGVFDINGADIDL